MFKPMPVDRERSMDNRGKMRLHVKTDGSKEDFFPLGEYDISYVPFEHAPHKYEFFKCSISSSESLLIVRELQAKLKISEASVYYFFSRAVDCIEEFAKSRKKDRVSIETNLPHCTEVLADKEYEIVKKRDDEFFRAHKMINGG